VDKSIHKIYFIIILFLVYIFGVLFFQSKNLQKNVLDNEIANIKLMYRTYIEIFKNGNNFSSVSIKNKNYINNDEYVEEYMKTTPLFSPRQMKRKILNSITLKYIDKNKVLLDKSINDRVIDLNDEDSSVVQNGDNLVLFGRVADIGYVTIEKDISDSLFLSNIIKNSFIKLLILIAIFIIIFVYMYKKSTLLSKRKKELELEYKILEKDVKDLAFVDSMTKADSRLKFSISLADLIETSKRFESPFILILFDVDNFKKVNDTFGHDYGDIVLKNISTQVKKEVRKSDIFARWGGEEFVIILPRATIEEGIVFSEKLRRKIENIKYEKIDSVTCSFGVVKYIKGDDEKSMIKRVDELLYKAKSSGRNCIKYEEM